MPTKRRPPPAEAMQGRATPSAAPGWKDTVHDSTAEPAPEAQWSGPAGEKPVGKSRHGQYIVRSFTLTDELEARLNEAVEQTRVYKNELVRWLLDAKLKELEANGYRLPNDVKVEMRGRIKR